MSAFRITTKLYLPGKAPMTAINLPIRNTPKGIPYADWTMPDWEDNGWNKAMRECAIRLNDAGIPVVILENEQPNAQPSPAGEKTP